MPIGALVPDATPNHMTELEAHPSAPVLEDPSTTRLMLRRVGDPRGAGLLQRAGAVSASVTVVAPTGGDAAESMVSALESFSSPHVRVELLVMEDGLDQGHGALRERLSRSAISWRTAVRPPGGRAGSLAAATAAAEHEFLLVGSGAGPRYDQIDTALSLMWTEGADIALVHAGEDDAADAGDAVDPSATLSAWLGLGTPVPEGRLVLMRRWVARWLFNEITRAISPGDEIADRARLLGVGIVELAWFAPDLPVGADD